jgi:hypothetical protein
MNPQNRRCGIRTISTVLTLFGLLGLCAASATAQLPDQEQGAEPVARPRLVEKPAALEKPAIVIPDVKQGLTPPVYKDPQAALRSAKLIYVRSTSLLVGVPVIEEKLQKRPEFAQLCLVITRDIEEADLVLVVEHDLFTKYVYTAIHKDTNIVVASGKLSSLGGTVGGKVAKRFLKQVLKARGSTGPTCGS